MNMKKKMAIGVALSCVVAVWGVVMATGVHAQLSDSGKAPHVGESGTMGNTWMGGHAPMCPMPMMAASDMPEATRARMDMMMRTPIYPDSPCAIYGQADRLGLTDDQRAQLTDIESEARQKALDVLTREQREALGEISGAPMAMMEMCQDMSARMMSKMQRKVGGNEMGRSMMGCCPMMGGASEVPGTKPEGSATK